MGLFDSLKNALRQEISNAAPVSTKKQEEARKNAVNSAPVSRPNNTAQSGMGNFTITNLSYNGYKANNFQDAVQKGVSAYHSGKYTDAYNYFKMAADFGDDTALNALGIYYEEGLAAPADYQNAMDCYQKAAAKNNMYALYNIGSMYERGDGVPIDYSQAIAYYTRAGQAGHPNAQKHIDRVREGLSKYSGVVIDSGVSANEAYNRGVNAEVTNDRLTAYQYYRIAASKGHNDALNKLGNCFKDGKGVAQDVKKARHYYLEAAKGNNKYALFNLAKLSEQNDENHSRIKETRNYYYRAVKAGNSVLKDLQRVNQIIIQNSSSLLTAEEAVNLGREEWSINNFTDAFAYYELGAHSGNVEGEFLLGNMYYDGKGCARDLNMAYKWYEKAAIKRNLYGCYNFAKLHARGHGTERNLLEARRWYMLAADAGHPSARAFAYYVNEQLPEKIQINPTVEELERAAGAADSDKQYWLAYMFYEMIENQKNSDSIENTLGNMLLEGKGCQLDFDKARAYYEKAAQNNNKYAYFNLGMIYEHGKGVAKDYNKAREYYLKAKELGNNVDNSIANINSVIDGTVYSEFIDLSLSGEELMKKGAECESTRRRQLALQYFEAAVDKGNSDAMNSIGNMYRKGEGTSFDLSKALYWYNKAAEQGNRYAYFNLAEMYTYGLGVEQNFDEADKYYQLAINAGNNVWMNKEAAKEYKAYLQSR